MKKIILSALFFAITLSLDAQNIEVGFKPKDSGVIIDSIRATNLNTNQSVKLTGSESLTLVKSSTTGIGDIPVISDRGQVYPNPCDGITNVCFSTSKSEEVNVRVFNASGQLVCGKELLLDEGLHRFYLQLPVQGMYFINVQKGESLNYKMVSTAEGVRSAAISYIGSEQESFTSINPNPLKGAFVNKTLSYSDGNNIMYTVYSGKNATVTTDKAGTSKIIEVAFYPCADKDGRNYKTVTIGKQVWMAENLAYLPFTTPITKSSYSEPCYYVYNLNEYGVFYNWIAAMKSCPEGWHLPLRGDWQQLSNYLGLFCGIKMKVTSGWKISDYVGSNESGFSGLPGGHLATSMPKENPKSGVFYGEGVYSSWWEGGSDPNNIGYSGSSFGLTYSSFNLGLANAFPYEGHHVRCIKN